jgi:hypothetical protein
MLLPLLVFPSPQLPPDSVEVPRADPHALCIASPSVSMTPARLSPSRNVVAIRWACGMHCGSIFGLERCAMIGELQSRCSELLSAAVPGHRQRQTYLALEIHSGRACQVTIVICLLHRSCWLPTAQHCMSLIERLCMQKRRGCVLLIWVTSGPSMPDLIQTSGPSVQASLFARPLQMKGSMTYRAERSVRQTDHDPSRHGKGRSPQKIASPKCFEKSTKKKSCISQLQGVYIYVIQTLNQIALS